MALNGISRKEGSLTLGAGVAIETDGALYGTTSLGGYHNKGVVWMIKA